MTGQDIENSPISNAILTLTPYEHDGLVGKRGPDLPEGMLSRYGRYVQ